MRKTKVKMVKADTEKEQEKYKKKGKCGDRREDAALHEHTTTDKILELIQRKKDLKLESFVRGITYISNIVSATF